MGYRTSAKHALNGPPTALLPIAAQSRSLPPMPASRHASAAGKCAATMAALLALMRPAADGKTGAMVITLPLGLNLTEPVLVKVDNGTAERQSIQTCTNVGCFVAMTLTDKFIAAMRAGSDLKITVQDANKKPIEMSLPLLGFGIAFDKAK